MKANGPEMGLNIFIEKDREKILVNKTNSRQDMR